MTMNDDLLVKHLLGEANAAERAAVEAWIAASPENAATFRDFKTIWDRSRELAGTSEISVDAAWERFNDRVAGEDAGGKTIPLRPRNRFRIAATIALLICCGTVFWLVSRDRNGMIALHSDGAPRTDTLPDGSVVTLNKGASLRYPRRFSDAERLVTLDGEAFFEVAPDKSHPFIIAANETRVRVVGTSFNVNTAASRTEVIVATGVVEVSRAADAVRLLPHEAATVYQGRAGIDKRKTDDLLYNYYHTREFVCNGTPLSRLAEVLSEAYDVDIQIPEPQVGSLPLFVTFQDESLPQVLEVISGTFNLRAEQNGRTITIRSR